MSKRSQRPVDERARELLRMKITGEGEPPNLLSEFREIEKEVCYLEQNGYVVLCGDPPRWYSPTEEGEAWALGD